MVNVTQTSHEWTRSDDLKEKGDLVNEQGFLILSTGSF